VHGGAGRSGPGLSSPSLVWEAREVVEVARGLLEVRACASLSFLFLLLPSLAANEQLLVVVVVRWG